MKPEPGSNEHDPILATGPAEEIRRESARRTRRSFLVGGAVSAAAAAAAYYIDHTPDVGRLQSALRHTENFNASVAHSVFNERGLAPTYNVSQAIPLRLNGTVGMDQALDLSSWRLQLVGARNAETSPFYTKDVTAWTYRYTGDMPDSAQAEDVKSAPGNGAATKTGQPAAQSPADNKTPGASPAATGKVTDLNPTGATDSDAAVSITEKFQALASGMSKKRNQGDAEAGPSYSSLDIGTPGLLLSMPQLAQLLPRVEFVTQFQMRRRLVQHHPLGRLSASATSSTSTRPSSSTAAIPATSTWKPPTATSTVATISPPPAIRNRSSSPKCTANRSPRTTAPHSASTCPSSTATSSSSASASSPTPTRKPDDYWTKLGYDWYAGL